MMDKFKAVKNSDGHDWTICFTGQDEDNNYWNVATNYIHASELHEYSRGAKGDAELIAELLNKHYERMKG